jgi:hypothetical protein
MHILAKGWKRDHGTIEVAAGDVVNSVRDDEVMAYDRNKTYVRVLGPRSRTSPSDESFTDRDCDQTRVRISVSGAVSMNGRYQVQCYLTKSDIAELFQLTHAEDSFDEVVADLAKLRRKRVSAEYPPGRVRRRVRPPE